MITMATKNNENIISRFLYAEESIAPLITFRIAFGIMMFLSIARFWANGWIYTLYIQPKYFFTFYGFHFVKPLPGNGMYVVFVTLAVCALFIAAGFLYRISSIVFFVLFTYVELIDKTNYLNHYYFISIISFLLCLLPANRFYSVDSYIKFCPNTNTTPRWTVLTLQLQMCVVYFFAGIAKINTDWLLNAMPLKIWLTTKTELPFVGAILSQPATAYAFSWGGMLFDVCIAFFLLNRKTVWPAYLVVVLFHVITAILFPAIGMFPFIMIVCATIFLPTGFHQRLIGNNEMINTKSLYSSILTKAVLVLLFIHFTIQLLLPFRYLLYPGKLFYTEQGYRFSWRVMLMEKAGVVFFKVKDKYSNQTIEVNNSDYLTYQQEKQMSTQPDMIVQFAHYLQNVYSSKMKKPEVYAESYITINGSGSRLYIDSTVNLAAVEEGITHKKWIITSNEY